MPAYWFNVFTEETWQEAEKIGFSISGFSRTRFSTVQRLKRGDILICYLKGLKILVGALRVTGDAYLSDEPRIWNSQPFPARVPVEPIEVLDTNKPADFLDILPKLSFFRPDNPRSSWARLQGSPTQLDANDGELLLSAVRAAKDSAGGAVISRLDGETKPEAGGTQNGKKLLSVDPLREIISELDSAQRDVGKSSRFEKAIADAFQFLGFDADWDGHSGSTDVVVESRLGHDRFIAVVDAKASSTGRVSESHVNWAAINSHRQNAEADYAVVVGERFAGGNLLKFAVEYSIGLVETSQLIEALQLHARTPFFAADIRPLFSSSGHTPDLTADLRQKSETTERHWQLLSETIRLVDTFGRNDPPVIPTLGHLHGALLATREVGEFSPSEQDVRDAVSLLTSRAVGILRPVDPPETAGYRLTMSSSAALQRIQALNNVVRHYLAPIATPGRVRKENSSN